MAKAKEEHNLRTAFYDNHLNLIWNEIERPSQYEPGIRHGETCECCKRIHVIDPKSKKSKGKRKERNFVRIV